MLDKLSRIGYNGFVRLIQLRERAMTREVQIEWPVKTISYGSLSEVNVARKSAGEKPIPTVIYECYSPNDSRRTVYDYGTVDNEPELIAKRRAAGWRISRRVLCQCGIDTLNPLGWGYYAYIDEPFITPGWETLTADHRVLCK